MNCLKSVFMKTPKNSIFKTDHRSVWGEVNNESNKDKLSVIGERCSVELQYVRRRLSHFFALLDYDFR